MLFKMQILESELWAEFSSSQRLGDDDDFDGTYAGECHCLDVYFD